MCSIRQRKAHASLQPARSVNPDYPIYSIAVLTPRPTPGLCLCTVSLPLQDGTHSHLYTVNTAVKCASEPPKVTNELQRQRKKRGVLVHCVIVLKNGPSVHFLNITIVLFSYFALARVRQVDHRSLKLNPTSGNVHGTISQLRWAQSSPDNVFPRCGEMVAMHWSESLRHARGKAKSKPLSETNSGYMHTVCIQDRALRMSCSV